MGARMHGLHDVDRRRIGDRRGLSARVGGEGEGARDGGCHVVEVLVVSVHGRGDVCDVTSSSTCTR